MLLIMHWKDILAEEKQSDYFKEILSKLEKERLEKHLIYPAPGDIFNAFKFTCADQVKVVIIGQDPYHGPSQAHGLSFSVPMGVAPPPSLINIFKELSSDVGITIPDHGNLTGWAKQGVLLLNSVLTVRAHQAGSHRHLGWEHFTDNVIKKISAHSKFVVFLLWGAYAQKKATLIDTAKHAILTAPHPSPLSAHRGFLGCKHFSKTNELLKAHELDPISWGDFDNSFDR